MKFQQYTALIKTSKKILIKKHKNHQFQKHSTFSFSFFFFYFFFNDSIIDFILITNI